MCKNATIKCIVDGSLIQNYLYKNQKCIKFKYFMQTVNHFVIEKRCFGIFLILYFINIVFRLCTRLNNIPVDKEKARVIVKNVCYSVVNFR